MYHFMPAVMAISSNLTYQTDMFAKIGARNSFQNYTIYCGKKKKGVFSGTNPKNRKLFLMTTHFILQKMSVE